MSNDLKHKAIASTAWKFAERLCAQGVSLVVSLILARLLTPDDYGVVSIVTIFFTFANVLISGGLNSALIQKKDADAEDYSSVLFVSLLVSVGIYAVLFFTAPAIAAGYGNRQLVPIFRVMGLILPVTAVKSVVCAGISANLQFRKFFLATIVGTVISAAVGIGMALRGCGAWSLVAQQMTNTAIDTLILLLTSRFRVVLKFSPRRFRPLFRYGGRVLLSSLIDTTYNQLNPLFIGLRYSGADLSFYNRGQTLPDAASSMINSTLSAVLFPVLSKVQDDRKRLLSGTRLFIRVSSYLVFPAMLGFFAVSDSFVRVVLTEKWLPAVTYIRIFCVSSMFTMISTGNCETIKAMGRSDVFLKIEILKKLCYFATIALFIAFSRSPVTLAVSSIVCTAIAIAVNTFPNRRLLGYSYRMQLADLLPNLLTAITMAAAVLLLGRLPLAPAVLLPVQIVAGAALYLALSAATKNQAFRYLCGLLPGLRNRKQA